MSVTDQEPPAHPVARREEHHLAQLLQSAAGGDTGAFLRFYDATVPVVYRYARMCAGSEAAADALARSIYERAWRTAGTHPRSGLSPLAWLLRRDDANSHQQPVENPVEVAR